jgi:single-strand DNA-binding protein
MVNKVILIGNVGSDPVIRCFDNGNQVASVCLITSERFKDKDGNKREQSELHNVEAWGQPAGIIDQYVRKGDRLYIEGQLHYEEYTSQNGEKRQRTTIRLRELKLLTPKQKQEETQQEQPQAQATPEPPQVPLPPMPDDIDGLPF